MQVEEVTVMDGRTMVCCTSGELWFYGIVSLVQTREQVVEAAQRYFNG